MQETASQGPNVGGPSAAHTNSAGSGLLSMRNADRSMHITGLNGGGGTQHRPDSVRQLPMLSSLVANCPPMADPAGQKQPFWQPPRTREPPFLTSMEAANYSIQASQALDSTPGECGKEAEKTEEDKMHAGEMYRTDDPELVKKRRQCRMAREQYENGQNPLHNVSEEEKSRLLRQVLQPQSLLESQSVGNFAGRGPGIVVETPFRCHYGYTIRIGRDVTISEDCVLIDDCGIDIGDNTWIGPGVQIISSMAVKDRQRSKGQNMYKGHPVKIECNCWIGPGSIILPGVIIRQGSHISPGEVVRT